MRKKNLIKILAIKIIVLFVLVGFQPAIADLSKIDDKNNAGFEESKSILIKTIVNIANDKGVRELVSKHKDVIDNFDISEIKQINKLNKMHIKNPTLFATLFSTRGYLSENFIYKTYEHGLNIYGIFGEEQLFQKYDKLKFKNSNLLNELKQYIFNKPNLRECIQNTISANDIYGLVCNILFVMFFATGAILQPFVVFYFILPIIGLLAVPFILILFSIMVVELLIIEILDCPWPGE